MRNFDYRRFHFVRYVFCFQYIFFHDDYCSFEGLSCSGVILFRNYPQQELLYSEWILFRSYPFQELFFSGTTFFRMIPFQEGSLSGTFLFRNDPFREFSFWGIILFRIYFFFRKHDSMITFCWFAVYLVSIRVKLLSINFLAFFIFFKLLVMKNIRWT